MKRTRRPSLLPLALVVALAAAFQAPTAFADQTNSANKASAKAAAKPISEEQLIAKAKGIHQRVLTLDTHNDIDVNNFAFSRNYTQELENQVTFVNASASVA